MSSFPSVRRRPWVGNTLTLRQLKERVDQLVDQLSDGQDGSVVIVTGRGQSLIFELSVQQATMSLSDRIETAIGDHLNRLSSGVTELELEDVGADKDEVLAQAGGDVLYLFTGEKVAIAEWVS